MEEKKGEKHSYRGNSYQIPCSRGGLNASINKVFIPPESMVMGSKNLNLKGARQKRGGTSKVNSTTIGASLRLMGIFDFLKPAGSQFIVFATNDGKIWKSTTLTIKVGLSTNKYVNMEQFGSTLFICNNADVPQTWGGTGDAAAMTKIPSDWAGTNYPSQFIRHGKGVSERLWSPPARGRGLKLAESSRAATRAGRPPRGAMAFVKALLDSASGSRLDVSDWVAVL